MNLQLKQPMSYSTKLAMSTCLYCGSPIVLHQETCNYCGCHYIAIGKVKKKDIIDMTKSANEFKILSFEVYKESCPIVDIFYKGMQFKTIGHIIDDQRCTVVYAGDNENIEKTFSDFQYMGIKNDYLFDFKDKKILCKNTIVVSLKTDYNSNGISIKRAELLPDQITINNEVKYV